MPGPDPARPAPDPSEVARARADYGAALRDLRAARKALQEAGGADPGFRRRVGEAEDRVTRAAARLAALTGKPG